MVCAEVEGGRLPFQQQIDFYDTLAKTTIYSLSLIQTT